jgi:hypothetical protein
MERIVRYLAGLFRELADGLAYSSVLQLDIADAPARGRVQRLLIAHAEQQGCLEFLNRWWVVDELGLREDASPLPSRHPDGYILLPENFFFTSPLIRFPL